MRSPVQIYEFIEDILNKRGISDRQMLTDAGLKRGVLDNMKKGSMQQQTRSLQLQNISDCQLILFSE